MTGAAEALHARQGARHALQRGHAQEAQGQITAALAEYDRAITLLAEHGEPPTSPAAGDLAIAWMNRGNALQRLDEPSRTDAIGAYDQAISRLERLPLTHYPAWAISLGAAWLNRGHALLALDPSQAESSLQRAVRVLEAVSDPDHPAARRNLAGAWVNLAELHLSRLAHTEAGTFAEKALACVRPHEDQDAAYATLGLQARRSRCAAYGHALLATTDDDVLRDELAKAGDLVDEGLALARLWETRGVSDLRMLAGRLFRFGARLYARHQPHFLNEFLTEQLHDPGADPWLAHGRETAREALTEAREILRALPFDATRADDRHRLDILRGLDEAAARYDPPS
jgi:tetratricopeptide (TPR) repeat protein